MAYTAGLYDSNKDALGSVRYKSSESRRSDLTSHSQGRTRNIAAGRTDCTTLRLPPSTEYGREELQREHGL